jgi:DNA-binding NarL/FixJ family response regulator
MKITGESESESTSGPYLVIDALPLRRVAAVRLLEALDGAGIVVAVAKAEELRNGVEAGSYRLALLNLGGLTFSDCTASAQVAMVREMLTSTPLVVVSDHDEPDEVVRAFRAGVQGFLPTSSQTKVAVGALELVLAGGMYFPPSVAALTATTGKDGTAASSTRAPPSWTEREQAVAQHLRQGRSNKGIARELGIRESTVKMYVRHVMRKLGAANRTEAAHILTMLNGSPMANGHAFPPPSPGDKEAKL